MIYTSGEVSRLCQVSMSTVNKWFDSGRLRGFRVPGSKHRRIPRENLISFLQEHGYPLTELLDVEKSNVLIVSQDRQLVESLMKELSAQSCQAAVATSGFDAGVQTGAFDPDCLVVDFGIGAKEAARICQHWRRTDAVDRTLVAICSSVEQDAAREISFDDTFVKPFDPELLVARLQSLVKSRVASA